MYGIICDARKSGGMPVSTLALVDRARSTRLWWTSDNANIAICYEKRSAADFAVSRLKKNRARVVPFVRVQQILSDQADRIRDRERQRFHEACLRDADQSWDAHKDTF